MSENKTSQFLVPFVSLTLFLGSTYLLTAPAFGAIDGVVFSESKIGFADDIVCATPLVQLPEVLKSVDTTDPTKQETALEGDEMDLIDGNKVIMTGNAYAVQGSRGIFADKITYDQDNYNAIAEGNVVYYTQNGDQIKAKFMQLEVDTFIGDAINAEMRLVKSKTNGKKKKRNKNRKGNKGNNIESNEQSKKSKINYIEDYTILAPFLNRFDDQHKPVEILQQDGSPVGTRVNADKIALEGNDFQRVYNARITNCPKGEAVLITSKEVELDHGEGVGRAKNATLRFKGVPILYAPRFSFPLNDERKSGFLAPRYGEDEDSGSIISVPYYFNIAPQYDATVRPTFLANRGFQLYSEFRYMNKLGGGTVKGEVLPDDDLFDGKERYAYGLDFTQRFSKDWEFIVDLQDVSDTSYLNDFRNDINITSSTFLPQTVQLNYEGDMFYMRSKASKFTASSADLTNPPLDRLPIVQFGIEQQDMGPLEFNFDGEFVNFDSDDESKTVGKRLNLTPSISMPITPIYGYIEPKLSFRSINYQLDNLAAGADDAPSVAAPIFSVDSGLYFERSMTLSGKQMHHTLEPRVMYVYIPEENQDDLPIFDTGAGSSVNSYDVLFREERLFGGDRIGDDHHISIGVETQISDDDTGKELLSASIGQMYYIDDRDVGTSADSISDTSDKSDIFADLNITFTDEIKMDTNLRWDQQENEFTYFNLGVDYHSGDRRALSVDYYKNEPSDAEDLRLRLDWPIMPKIQLRADERFSLEDNEFRASSIGLVYDNCCWALGLKATRLLKSDGEYRNAIIATLELDGLGSIQASQ